MNRVAAIVMLTFLALLSGAQTNSPVMADSMREDGKIYVVIGVIAVIFVSILVFLVFIERRLAKLERRIGSGRKEG